MVKIIPEAIKTDVTAIKYISGRIITGIGNCIQIFEKNGKHLRTYTVFSGQKIHGIIPNGANKLAVFGANYLKLFDCFETELSEILFHGFEDWVMDLLWLKGDEIAVTFANNYVGVWDFKKCVFVNKIACSERCIIYSACIVNNSWDDLYVLSGTVFNEILVWKPSNNHQKLSNVICRLKGHDGVIFSINYNKSVNLIATTSDDRTVRLWNSENVFTSNSEVYIYPKTTIYGHTARVFRCKLMNSYVASTGEDGFLCVWDFNGKLIRKFVTHQGSTLWSLECNEDENFILTGGSDGAVSLYPIKLRSDLKLLPAKTNVNPRCLKFLISGNIAIINDNGLLKHYKYKEDKFVDVQVHEDLNNYAVMATYNQILLLAGYTGVIYIYKEENDYLSLVSTSNIKNKRIYSMHFLNETEVLLSEAEGKLSVVQLEETNSKYMLKCLQDFVLPHSKERWATSAVLCRNYVAVGDRKGNIHLFADGTRDPVQTIKKSQSHLGVTALYYVNDQLVSFGRSGTVKKYSFNNSNFLENISNDKLPFSWLTLLTKRQNTILYLGFCGSNFVIWDQTRRRILFEMNCGGGHRSWDFMNLNDSIVFTFIKDKRVHHFTCKWHDIFIVDLIDSFHVKEINCVKATEISEHKLLFISGGEDTTVKLSYVDLNSDKSFQTISVLKSHLSSVRAAEVISVSNDSYAKKYFLFTAGGRAQIILWEISIIASENDYKIEHNQLDVYHKELSEKEAETRIMDLTSLRLGDNVLLISACSDGFLKCYIVNKLYKNKLVFIRDIHYGAQCVMRVSYVRLSNDVLLVTMATDGKVTFWDLTKFCDEIRNFNDLGYHQNSDQMVPFYSRSIHQSGINGYDFKVLLDDTLLVATGGDDNALNINTFRYENTDNPKMNHLMHWTNSKIHGAQINGVFLTDTFMIVASLDQNVSVFKYNCTETLNCELLTQYDSVIDDIQGCECILNEKKVYLCLFGIGIELCSVQNIN